MPPVWSSELIRLAVIVAAGGAVGWLYDYPAVGMLIAVTGLLAWYVYNLYRLDLWLRTGKLTITPDGPGVWPPVFARIEYIREKSRRRRNRWRQLVRELRASAGAFPDGGVLLNARHEIVTYNLAAQRLLGLRRNRDRGQRIENLLRHPDFVAFLSAESGQASVEIPGPTGGDTWISCLLIPYGPEQMLLLVRDVTENVRLERMRRDFVANASHELRTPLTVISGYLDAIADDVEAPASWRMPVSEMRAQAHRMGSLLDDLLQLSRLESGAPCSTEHAVDIGSVLQAARKEMLAMSGRSGTVQVTLGSTARILGDAGEIHSIVSNLLSNAVRYTPEDGTITVSWRADADGGQLAVIDTGIGIAEDEITRVTERFYRTDAGRALQKSGTGLGLAIVKHALRRHEADLEIQSRLGEGSTFTCHFPPHRIALIS